MSETVLEKKVGIKDLLKQSNYLKLIIANFISRFGDSIDSIAYAWMVYTLTGSKLLMGTLFAVNAIPSILLSPFSGVFADHFQKKKTIVICDLGRGLVVLLTAILFGTGYLRVWHLYLFTVLNSSFEAFSSPARASLMPLILKKEYFLSANGFSTSLSSLAELIGLGVAGYLIATINISGAIFIDAFTFFISAVIILMMIVNGDVKSERKLDTKTYFIDLKEGFSYIIKNKAILLIAFAAMVVNFSLTPLNVLQPVYVSEVLKSGPAVMSYLGIGLVVGVIISGLLVSQFGSNFKKPFLITCGFSIMGLSYTALSLPAMLNISGFASIIIAVLVFFLFGFSLPMINSATQSIFMEKTKPEILGRAASLLGMLCLCATPLGSALTGIVAEYTSIPVLYISMGILIVITGFALLLSKELRKA